ncbi:hypothetical protein B0H17DRAFT_60337 [Mycena rosella]|uniref:Uncharacterized protein n=1 Tax=Mycena rosella TaxID=1033263 RepID=A0AAD7AZQ4_MYCRO|nr:hypothetical protein B0H17DRAFT_60337 [Mycena rosella]
MCSRHHRRCGVGAGFLLGAMAMGAGTWSAADVRLARRSCTRASRLAYLSSMCEMWRRCGGSGCDGDGWGRVRGLQRTVGRRGDELLVYVRRMVVPHADSARRLRFPQVADISPPDGPEHIAEVSRSSRVPSPWCSSGDVCLPVLLESSEDEESVALYFLFFSSPLWHWIHGVPDLSRCTECK